MEQPEINKKEKIDKTDSALTSIHGTYTLSTQQNLDEIMMQNFLETLAAVSMSIAARKVNQDKGAEQCGQ